MKLLLPPILNYKNDKCKTKNKNIYKNSMKTNIKKYISLLPHELKLKIYKEYLEPHVYYSLYMRALNNKQSKFLNPVFIKPLIPVILAKKHVSNYLYNKCDAFRNSYQYHKIQKYKSFRYMNKGDSFTANILFYLYH